MIVNGYLIPVVTYDDCLQIWLSGANRSQRRTITRRCAGSTYDEILGGSDEWASILCRPRSVDQWTRSGSNMAFVLPTESAGHGAQGPNAFTLGFASYRALRDSSVAVAPWGEIHHHSEELGIGEHYRLTGDAWAVSFWRGYALPVDTSDVYGIGAADLGTAILDTNDARNEFAVIPQFEGDELGGTFRAYAAPVLGTRLPGESAPHEGTILLPDGSALTNVYKANWNERLRRGGVCGAVYYVDIRSPYSALLRARPPRRSLPLRRIAAPALALAGVGAAVASARRRR